VSIQLLKKSANIVLEKKKLQNVTARVGLVLDISGSMRSLYKVKLQSVGVLLPVNA